jgi:hypothetical protein
MKIIRGNIKVEWVNLGEGWDGDYNPSDPSDVNLLRFDVYKRSNAKSKWEEVENASYCTQMPASTSKEILHQALEHIMNTVHGPILADGRAKRLCERLSWISPKDFIAK